MSKLDVHFKSGSNEWETPPDLYQFLDDIYGFTEDMAASEINRKHRDWYGPTHPEEARRDALVVPWGGTAWCNPPYDRKLQPRFVKKAVECAADGGIAVLLLPARTDTKVWHNCILPYANQIYYVRGRLQFVGAPAKAPFPSVVVEFRDRGLRPIQTLSISRDSFDDWDIAPYG